MIFENVESAESEELPLFSLVIHPYDLYMLGSPLSNEAVSGYLSIENKTFDISVKYRGHHTRNLPKRSYFIQLKNPNRFNGYREFHLNAEYNDPSFVRNKLSLDLFQSFGVLAPISWHIRLNLNGKYQGVYLLIESVDDLFLKKRGLPFGQIYYAVNNNANFSLTSPFTNAEKVSLAQGYQRKVGSYNDVRLLEDFIRKIHVVPSDDFAAEISQVLDVEKYLRWLVVAVCTQNLDGFYHNYALYRNSETERFEIMPWDYDATFGRDWDGNPVDNNVLPFGGKNILSSKLLAVQEFNRRYRELMKEFLDTFFTPQYLKPIVTALLEAIRPHLIFSSQMEVNLFNGEKDLILNFVNDRNQYLREKM